MELPGDLEYGIREKFELLCVTVDLLPFQLESHATPKLPNIPHSHLIECPNHSRPFFFVVSVST